MTTGRAPGKVILLGEHAVVYGRPAIAAPVEQLEATVEVVEAPAAVPGRIRLETPDIGRSTWLDQAGPDDPLAAAVRLALARLAIAEPPSLEISVASSIPVASGLGSGAAVTVALLRALSAHLGRPFPDGEVSALTFEIEKLHHGTPSGIDNSVIALGRPVYFRRGQPIERIVLQEPLHLVIAVSGQSSSTARAVGQVRSLLHAEPQRVEPLFDSIGELVEDARRVLSTGPRDSLGPLLDENHRLLADLGLSTPGLERLIAAARAAGASGAKLSGAGLGGNILALVEPTQAEAVQAAVRRAGAIRTIVTQVNP